MPPGAVNGTSAQRHQPGGGHHRNLRRHKLRDSRLPAGADGTFTTIDAPGFHRCYIGGSGYLASSHQPGRGDHGNVLRRKRSWLTASCASPDGTLTTFDAPGAAIAHSGQGINPAGDITGIYFDASFVGHGFLRARHGTFTTFDVPGASAAPRPGINPAGAIVGNLLTRASMLTASCGLPMAPSPRSMSHGVNGTQPYGINPAGAITGFYY